MATAPPFTLSRASLSDLEEILDLQYDCFPQQIRITFMGCFSRGDIPKIRQRYVREMEADRHLIWLKVVDRETGKIIAACQWKVYVNGAPSDSDDPAPEWLEGQTLEDAKKTAERVNAARARANPGPYLYLHLCFTDARYRRLGAGGMMLKWGCDVADLLHLPGWIEASEEGNFLYKMHGFYDFETMKVEYTDGDEKREIAGTNMRRDPRNVAIESGKAPA